MRAKLTRTVIAAPHLRAKPRAERPAVAAQVVVRRVAASFTRRVRAYAAAGLLVPTAERHRRRAACAACDFAEATGHRGLYRCKHRSCGCGGGDELRMAIPATKCPLSENNQTNKGIKHHGY